MATLIIGWRSFVARRLSMKDLFGVKDTADGAGDFTIEGHRRYFHLFYIPFFPIGKSWAVRSGTLLLPAPPEVLRHIQEKNIRIGKLWLTFTGPILIALVVLGLALSAALEKKGGSVTDNSYDRFLKNQWTVFEPMVNHPDTNDYYVFIKCGGGKYLGKVISSDAEKTNFRMSKMYGDKNPQTQDQFETYSGETSITTELKRADRPMLERAMRNGCGSFSFNDTSGMYAFEAIYRINEPWLVSDENKSTGDSDADGHFITIKNFGPPITIKKIESLNNIHWASTIAAPHVERNALFEVYSKECSAEDAYALRITCVDEQNKIYRFRVEGFGNMMSIGAE